MLMIKIMCRQLTPVNSHSAPHCVLETHKSRRNHKYQVDRWERARALQLGLLTPPRAHMEEHTSASRRRTTIVMSRAASCDTLPRTCETSLKRACASAPPRHQPNMDFCFGASAPSSAPGSAPGPGSCLALAPPPMCATGATGTNVAPYVVGTGIVWWGLP